uniref:Uncharacterized protein n=1 Tax=Arundo donax TaxID=35708 RepID=A0A0A9CN97_ARUDO
MSNSSIQRPPRHILLLHSNTFHQLHLHIAPVCISTFPGFSQPVLVSHLMVLTRNKVTGITADLTLLPNIGEWQRTVHFQQKNCREVVLHLASLSCYGYYTLGTTTVILLLLQPLKELELYVVSVQPELQTLAFLLLACRRRESCGVKAFRCLWRRAPPDQGPVQAFEEEMPLDLSSSS